MTSSSYAAVLRTPHASRTFALAFLGRLSYGTVFLSLTLALTASTGSYAQAGALLALEGLTVSVLSPVRAALIDRHGPRRALPPMTAAYALVLTAFAALTWRPGAPLALLAVLAVAAGVTAPPVGVVMRTLWSGLLPAGPLLRRAYSLDTVSEELVFVAGPLLAGLLAAAAAPSLGILVSAVLIAAGTAGHGHLTGRGPAAGHSGRHRRAGGRAPGSSRPPRRWPRRRPASSSARPGCSPSPSPSATTSPAPSRGSRPRSPPGAPSAAWATAPSASPPPGGAASPSSSSRSGSPSPPRAWRRPPRSWPPWRAPPGCSSARP
ncbi:MFS transporter [Actinomadura madurae]|uniref:MFS transporter n=1 Tax=Actinomadura madurae TaxID=1993 RepID=UPI003556B61F